MVGAPNEWTRLNKFEAALDPFLFVFLELLWGDEGANRKLPLARAEVLTDRHHVDIDSSKIVHDSKNFILSFTKPNHDTGLGYDGWIDLLRPAVNRHGSDVASAGTNLLVQARNRLDVVVEDVDLSAQDSF